MQEENTNNDCIMEKRKAWSRKQTIFFFEKHGIMVYRILLSDVGVIQYAYFNCIMYIHRERD